MKKKQSAGLTFNNALQLVFFYLSSGLVSFSLGWAFYGSELGFYFCLWSCLVGPLVFFLIYFLAKKTNYIRPLNIQDYPHLTDEIFRMINLRPGPRIRFLQIRSNDPALFWMRPLFSKHNELIVHHEWLQEEKAHQQRQIQFVWNKMKRLNKTQQKLRSLAIALWVSFFLPIDIACTLFRKTLLLLHVPEFSTPQFHAQRLAWKIFQFYFGNKSTRRAFQQIYRNSFDPSKKRRKREFHEPVVWSSLSLGVWNPSSLSRAHPSWQIIMHRDAFLPI